MTATFATRAHTSNIGRPVMPPVLAFELTKLTAPWRNRLLAALLLVGPAAFVVAVGMQQNLPADTAFGRWMHVSGLAGMLVVLSFAGQWILPLVVPVLAAETVSGEDRMGTWRHMVLAVRSIPRLFRAKVVTSMIGAALVVMAVFVSALVGGAVSRGLGPLVGLDGQTIPAAKALGLVLVAWACAAVASLSWAALGLLCGVLLGRSPAALVAPAAVALALTLAQMLPLPIAIRTALPSSVFLAWRGLFTAHPQTGALVVPLVVNLAWTVTLLLAARWAMRRRDFTDLTYDGAPRHTLLLALSPLVVLFVAAAAAVTVVRQGGPEVTRDDVQNHVATTFSNLYVMQTAGLGRPPVTTAQMGTSAQCGRNGDPTAADSTGAGNDWRCTITWHLPDTAATGTATYQLEITGDGRIRADGDGPAAVNGWFQISGTHGPQANPLWQFDSLVDLLDVG